ncbi:unknown [Firmicutes bacterium CAG:882]|nr:unknown [Firmicutes bacterium CAG:882]
MKIRQLIVSRKRTHSRLFVERQPRHVVVYSDCEAFLLVICKHRHYLFRSRVLGAETVTPAVHRNALKAAAFERGNDIDKQRLTDASCLLRPVEHRNLLHSLGNTFKKMLHRKRSVKMHLYDADLLLSPRDADMRIDKIHDLLYRLRHRAHRDNDMCCPAAPVVVKKPVICPQPSVYLGKISTHNLDKLCIISVRRLSRLKKYIGILCRTRHERPVRI